jgi:branched-chain amino acid aminotransferase group I
MKEKVYLNGSLVPRAEAKISIADHGLLYGYGLFETMRAYHGRIFLLEQHIGRLLHAADAIGLGKKLAGLDLAGACRDTVSVNKLKEARVRLTVTGGETDAMPWTEESSPPTVLVTARLYRPFAPEVYKKGFRAGIASVKRSRQSVLSSLKSINYLVNVIARREAAEKGLDEAVILNDEGYIAEGAGSNIFFVREGRLVTPALNSGILPGITREAVIELSRGLGISVSEGPVGIGALKRCEEAFLTNAVMEIMPLVSITDPDGNSLDIGGGRPGPVTQKLMAAYGEKVKRETGS